MTKSTISMTTKQTIITKKWWWWWWWNLLCRNDTVILSLTQRLVPQYIKGNASKIIIIIKVTDKHVSMFNNKHKHYLTQTIPIFLHH